MISLFKKHRYQLIIISLFTLLTWYKIFFQTPNGEGFYYFNPDFSIFKFPSINYDTGAGIIYNIFVFFFKDNLQIFQGFILFSLVLLSLFFYWFVYEITNNKTISLISSLIFSTNYIGAYEMVGIGNYQFFTQRAFWFLLLLPSFAFFVKYLKFKKEKHFIISFLLYTFSIYFAQFSIFFLPLFFTYFMVHLLWEWKKISFKKFAIASLRIIPYFLISFLILFLDSHYAKVSVIKFQSQDRDFFVFLTQYKSLILGQFLRQLSVLIIPEQIIKLVALKKQVSFGSALSLFYLPSVLLYVGLGGYLLKKENKFRILILALFLFTPVVFVLNSFMRADMIAGIESGSRYLYVPMTAMSILWSILIYSLILSRKIVIKFFILVFFILFIYTQITAVWKNMDEDFYLYKGIKISLNYIKEISPKIGDDSFVIVPSILGYHGANFSQLFYGKKHSIFLPSQSSWHKRLKHPFDIKKDYILEYDKQKEKVVDMTKDYQEIISKKMEEEP